VLLSTLPTRILITCSIAALASAAPAQSVERVATTEHAVTLGGHRLAYTAEAGRITLPDSTGAPRAAIFYVAYRVASHAPRPLTFVWNGGPGANALGLHLMGLGPKRIAGQALVDNQQTLLDASDLVFMDPAGTGFSRAASAAAESTLYSTLGDFEATAQFIRLWRAAHAGARGPVYLVGESYGSWRAAAVAERLGALGDKIAGIVLISGGCPVGPIQPPEIRAALRVPAWALTALQHGRLPARPGARDSVIAAARRWALDRYAPALARVADLSEMERDTMARELASTIGLPAERIDRRTVAVTPHQFREQLLGSRGLTLDIFDMRRIEPMPELPAVLIGGYLRNALGYRTSLAYRTLEREDSTLAQPVSVNERWSYDSGSHTAADLAAAGAGEGPPGAQPWVLGALANHSGLRVFVAAGRYDSFTPCWANEDLATRLPADVVDRFTFRCYESGHMIASDDAARPQFVADLRAWLADGSGRAVAPSRR